MKFFIALYLGWFLFIACMGVKMAWPRLPTATRILAAPGMICAYVMDIVILNIPATVVFADLPREWTFSERMGRYKSTTLYGWRNRVAVLVCKMLLDPFQIGGHC